MVELDGFAGHGTRIAFREDRPATAACGSPATATTRITWAQLEDEPEAIAADLRALLALPAMQHTNVRDNVRRP